MTAVLMLNRTWQRWKKRRCREMIAEGLCADLAIKISRAEARARQCIARIIGKARAEAAELLVTEYGARVRFQMKGSLDGLTEAQITRLAREIGATIT